MDKVVVLTVIIIVLAGLSFWAWQSGIFTKISVPPAPLPPGIVLFYSPNCPHCKNVEDFVAANNIDQKVKFTKLEVPFVGKTSPQLLANAELAIQLAQGCKINVSNGVSIPFLYDGNSNCVVGDQDIISFFKNAAGIK